MRIVIDLQGAQTESRYRGIGRYTISLVRALAEHPSNHEIILALNGLLTETLLPIRQLFSDCIPAKNIRVWYAPGPISADRPENQTRREAAALIREAFLLSLEPDIIHIPSLFEGFGDDAVVSLGKLPQQVPVSVTVLDLIPYLYPEHYLDPNPQYKSFYLDTLKYLPLATSYVSISQSSLDEVLAFDADSMKPAVNASLAIDAKFSPKAFNTDVLNWLKIDQPFILYTGGGDVRKNLDRLIEAFALLPMELLDEHTLVLAGKMPDSEMSVLLAKAKHLGLSTDKVRLLGFVSDEELIGLYCSCKLFVFPSWHEGFGLPVLEAMSCGAAVIGANTTSVPEVLGFENALFDPYDVVDISAKMRLYLTDEVLRAELKEFGLKRATQFSWQKSADILVEQFGEMFHSSKYLKPETNIRKKFDLEQQLVRTITEYLPIDFGVEQVFGYAQAIAQNFPPQRLSSLFIDVSELYQRDAGTGVQRVTRSVALEFLQHPPPGYRVELVYATTSSSGYFYAIEFANSLLDNTEFKAAEYEAAGTEKLMIRAGDVFFGVDLQHHVVIAQQGYYDILSKAGVRVFFLVHDLLPIEFPQYFAIGMKEQHEYWLEVVSRYDGLISVSETTSKAVGNWLSQHYPERLGNIDLSFSHNGVDINASVPSRGLPEGYESVLQSLQANITFLMVGTIEPRKGYGQVLSAFECYWRDNFDVNLCIVGRAGWDTDSLIEAIEKHPRKDKNLFWLSAISDEYLALIYEQSSCLIAASEGEGFGLPLIEAAQHKLPLIVRDIDIFREVAGEHAFYFDATDGEGLCTALKSWLDSYRDDNHPKVEGMPWSNWHQCVDRLTVNLKLAQANQKRLPQLFVDVSELAQRDAKTGIQRVVRSVLVEIFASKEINFEPKLVYSTTESGYHFAESFSANFFEQVQVNDDRPIDYLAGDLFFVLDLNPQIVISQSAYYQRLRQDGVKVIFLIYDLLALNYPQWFPSGSYDGYRQWLEVVASCDGVICISAATADDLSEWLKRNKIDYADDFMIAVSHIGADIERSIPSYGLPDDAFSQLSTIQSADSFLMVGTLEPRKGYEQVISAFEILWHEDVEAHLVIVGKAGWLTTQLVERIEKHPLLGRKLFWFDGISDEYLEKLYLSCDCLIAASLGEGFGLPLIEAAQHNLPIIARDIPVFREVANQHATYFNGEHAEDLAGCINAWIRLFHVNNHIKSTGLEFLSWQQSVANLLSILNNCVLDPKVPTNQIVEEAECELQPDQQLISQL